MLFKQMMNLAMPDSKRL